MGKFRNPILFDHGNLLLLFPTNLPIGSHMRRTRVPTPDPTSPLIGFLIKAVQPVDPDILP